MLVSILVTGFPACADSIPGRRVTVSGGIWGVTAGEGGALAISWTEVGGSAPYRALDSSA